MSTLDQNFPTMTPLAAALRGQEDATNESVHPGYFCALPTEMKAQIFGSIRLRSDKRTVCLVSREWKAVMVPMLWESGSSSFETTSGKGLTALLLLQIGMIPHIKLIHLRKNDDKRTWHSTIESTLRLLFGALPRGSLLYFTSELKLPAAAFFDLLQLQPNLETLRTR
jgi:hypothetical protein